MARKMILCLFLLIFCMIACGGNEGNAEEDSTAENSKPVYYTLLETGVQSGIKEPGDVIITDQQVLDSVWDLHHSYIEGKTQAPDINFDEEVVVGIFLGEKPSTGYWLRFDTVRRDGDDLIVVATTNKDVDNSKAVLQVITYPYFFIVTEKPEGEIRFDLKAE